MKNIINIKDATRSIIKSFEPGSKTLGIDCRINFDKNELEYFLIKMDKKKVSILIKAVHFYSSHMSSLSDLLQKDNSYYAYIRKNTWSINATLVIISVLEFLLKELGMLKSKGKKDPFDYLKENFELIKSKDSIEKIKVTYYDKYPGPGKCITKFLEDYLEEDEIVKILNSYKSKERELGELKIEKLQEIINDIYRSTRSAFVHEMKSNGLSTESISVDLKQEEDKSILVVYPNLSINQLLYYSWVAIFRMFGFDGDMDDYFTKEEQKKGFSMDGTKISFRVFE